MKIVILTAQTCRSDDELDMLLVFLVVDPTQDSFTPLQKKHIFANPYCYIAVKNLLDGGPNVKL